jgi:CRISPR/Cas system CSM-associated protein Csm3 (group 7 of RAMP superfamily)
MSVRRFEILVRSDGSALALGGYSAPRLGGDKATARDRRERPLIPATALRGALRIELERLLRGDRPQEIACSANRAETDAGAPPCPCPVCRLFGEPGRGTGTLRLEDAVLAAEVEESPQLRPSVAVSRKTGAAVDKHLAFVETTGSLLTDDGVAGFRASARLVARGSIDDAESLDEDEANLRAACAALRAIGGGKARGLGWIECSLEAIPSPELPPAAGRTTAEGDQQEQALSLRFQALAPLHFGAGRQLGFFQGTQRAAPGSAVRGALAFALLDGGDVSAHDQGFQDLFGPAAPASFGSARAEGDVPSETRRRCRPEGHVFDDLVGELVRRAAANRGLALAVTGRGGCVHPQCQAIKILPSELRAGAPEIHLRVRTLTALNRLTGTSMDRKLYSVAAIEPEVILTAEVHGLTPEGARLLAGLDGREVWLGGKRSKGMGRCLIAVENRAEADPEAARRAIEALAAALREAWSAVAAAAGLHEPILGEAEVPLALVLREPWSPGPGRDEEALGMGPLAGAGLRLFDAFVNLAEEGRFVANEAEHYGAGEEVRPGEEPPRRVAAPGSVYVYAVARELLAARLPEWLALGLRGSGEQWELGWGRFVIRGPETDF